MSFVKSVRKNTHKLLSCIVGGVYKFLVKVKLFSPKVIVYIDGGICSQMHQYLIGKIYEDKGCDVYYDLKWFSNYGMDVDGKYERIYELERAFPYLLVKRTSSFTEWFYRFFLCYTSIQMELPFLNENDSVSPVYLGGYYSIPHDRFVTLFKQTFQVQSDVVNAAEGCSVICAIHVRRGDLAKGDNPFYGGCADSYFYNAISYVQANYTNVSYLFFSDEMDYVINNLMPNLQHLNCQIASPKRAYEDLLEMAKCDIIIASQGSFGKFAAMFNDNSLLILKNQDKDPYKQYKTEWDIRKSKLVYISE